MMPLKGGKHVRQTEPLDILSSLPENLIDDVLSRLCLRDAVRTSILSKKWRYTWCTLSELTLNPSDLRSTTQYLRLTTQFDSDISPASLILSRILRHLMTFHTGSITMFALDITFFRDSTFDIDNLVHFLSKRKKHSTSCSQISTVILKKKQYSLPSPFFTWFQLRHLALNNCLIQLPPPEFRGFDRLISLQLHRVTISSKLLENIISRSSCLEQLFLYDISMDVHVIEIYAPVLRSFNFSGSLRSVCLRNVPLLAEVSLREAFGNYTRDFDIAKFLESCCALEHLYLRHMFSSPGPGVAAGEVPTRLPFVLHTVKRLNVIHCLFTANTTDVVDRAFCLIKSFPNLQFLELEAMNLGSDDKLLDRHSGITFNHLREVKSYCLRGTMHEMEFIKLLLVKSPVLVRMEIKVYQPLEESARVEMLAGLSKCKPASLKAEVVIFNERESYRLSFV